MDFLTSQARPFIGLLEAHQKVRRQIVFVLVTAAACHYGAGIGNALILIQQIGQVTAYRANVADLHSGWVAERALHVQYELLSGAVRQMLGRSPGEADGYGYQGSRSTLK